MRKIGLLVLLISFKWLVAQEKIELAKQDGLVLTCTIQKLPGDSDKKDKYLFVINVENTNDYDVYYETGANTASSSISPLGYGSLAEIKAQNSVGFLSTGLEYIKGEVTGLTTIDNMVLYKIKRKSTIQADTKFSFKKDEKPVVTGKFRQPVKKLEEFQLAINATAINGNWSSACGNISMNLMFNKKPTGETVITQTINGKIVEWVKSASANIFYKTTDRTTSLTYNTTDGSLTYNNPDGIVCSWTKK